MTVTDGERLAIAVAKFDEAAALVKQGQKIIQYLFEVKDVDVEIPERIGPVSPCERNNAPSHDNDPSDPITGLYPGQKPDPEALIQAEDDETECLE